MTTTTPDVAAAGSTLDAAIDDAPTWATVLDSLAAQVDLQERCVRLGHAPPPDLELDVPSESLAGDDRLRALELFERCESLALAAARALAATRHGFRSAYADDATTASSAIRSTRS